MLPAASCVGCD